MACKSYYIVFDDTVSGAPETAPIEQSVCRPPPPAAHGHPPAPCGMAPACLGIAAPARRFYAAPMPLHHLPRLDYIIPTWPPPRTTHFLFSFLPFHPSYLVHWPPGRCGPHEGCRVIRWIRPFSRSFIIPPPPPVSTESPMCRLTTSQNVAAALLALMTNSSFYWWRWWRFIDNFQSMVSLGFPSSISFSNGNPLLQ